MYVGGNMNLKGFKGVEGMVGICFGHFGHSFNAQRNQARWEGVKFYNSKRRFQDN